ncbi:MAG: HAD hydrolase-like protein [Candidatus Buchananbacteria bacterium]
MNSRKIILFDFDGVIADTFEMANEIATVFFPGISKDEYRKMFESNVHDSVKSYIKQKDEKSHYQKWFAVYEAQILDQKIFPKMKSVLRQLSEKYILVIISSSINSPIEKYAKKHDLEKYFAKIFGADVHKSKIEKIKMVFKEYKVTAKDCLFITDTLGDLKEAKKMKVKSVAVTWGFHDKKTLAKGLPVAIVSQPDDLVKQIDLFFKKDKA